MSTAIERADRARLALWRITRPAPGTETLDAVDLSGECVEDVIRGILADVRHLCDATELEYARLDSEAHSLYMGEEGGAR